MLDSVRGAAESIEGRIDNNSNQIQAEKNQRVFAGAYNDFAEEYKKRYGEQSSNEEIGLAIESLLEKDKNQIRDQYELDMYNQARQMVETGEAIGYKDGTGYLRDTIRQVQNGQTVPNNDYVQKKYN